MIIFPCSADHEQDWQPHPVDLYSAICDDHTCDVTVLLYLSVVDLHAHVITRRARLTLKLLKGSVKVTECEKDSWK